jgi:Cd2+/Zn2+-exporting ATPase
VTAAEQPCSGCENERVHVFEIFGMDCAVEATIIEKALRRLPGVCSVRTSTVTRQATVVHTLEAETVRRAIETAGFQAREARRDPAPPAIPAWTTWAALAATAAGALLSLLGSPAAVAGFAVAVVVGGAPIARKGLRAARQWHLDMNALMTIAVVGASAIGQWAEGASTVVLFSLAQLLESRALERARRAIAGLVQLTPEQAVVRRTAGEVRVPVAEIARGETIAVGPGERVPLDGIVQTGTSELDEAPLTGESKPAARGVGEEVFAGSVNGPGALEIRVTRPAAETMLSRIVRRVEEAQASRAPSQGFVERFARAYTPLVIAAAVLAAVVPPLVVGGAWTPWFYRALVLLVVSCPCALVISTPVSIVSALTAASRVGVLIKGGAHLEAIGRARAIAFDKTGTLTQGALAVTEIVPVPGQTEDELLRLAAAVEGRSGHAIGHAVVSAAAGRGLTPPAAQDVVALAGSGVRGNVDGRAVMVGSHRWFDEEGLCDHRLDGRLAELEAAGRSAMMVASDGRMLGVLGVADVVRAEAAAAVSDLRASGLHVALLTGDNGRTAETIGAGVGIADLRSELRPDAKVEAVHDLARRHGGVVMVGDGINDAPALAASAVGIAMGTGASEAAVETADIALLHADLRLVPATIRLSRATAQVVRQNVVLSLGVKAVVLALTLSGHGSLWAAVAADMGASLVVIANGLRLLAPPR